MAVDPYRSTQYSKLGNRRRRDRAERERVVGDMSALDQKQNISADRRPNAVENRLACSLLFVPREGRARTACHRDRRLHSLPSGPGWAASSACSDLIYDRHRY